MSKKKAKIFTMQFYFTLKFDVSLVFICHESLYHNFLLAEKYKSICWHVVMNNYEVI